MSKEQVDSLEAALRDVMLLCEAEEIAADRKFIAEMGQNRSAEPDPLVPSAPDKPASRT